MRVQTLLCASFLFASFVSRAQSLKSFHDAQTGVSFSYPAAWSDGADVLFYLGSAITTFDEKSGTIPPRAKVGFVVDAKHGPYAGTNLNGVQFVYNEVPDADAAACRGFVMDHVGDESKIDTVRLRGVVYTHYSGGDAGLGHGVSREIYSVFRGGQCFLFEESIHFFNLTADGVKHLDMSSEQVVQLRKQLDAVMRSVRFGDTQSLKSFHDAQTGVSFSYPAAWSGGSDLAFYNTDVAFRAANGDPVPYRAKVGFKAWGRPGAYAGTNLDGVQFVYNEVPEVNAEACRKRVDNVADDHQHPVETIPLRGVSYARYSVRPGDGGNMNHEAEGESYATFRGGRCFLFDESIFTYAGDETRYKPLPREQMQELRNQLDAVMRSVRFQAAR